MKVLDFGQKLRDIRGRAGMPLRTLAERTGVSAGFLSRVERGEYPPPSEDRIRKIALALDQSPLYLIALAGKLPEALRRKAQADPEEMSQLLELIIGMPRKYLRFWVFLIGNIDPQVVKASFGTQNPEAFCASVISSLNHIRKPKEDNC